MPHLKYRIGYEWRNSKGKIYVFMPDNPMARSDGFVARARLVMAAMMQRGLQEGESHNDWALGMKRSALETDWRVYHKDEQNDNDDPENLLLFQCQADLAKYRSEQFRAKQDAVIKGDWQRLVDKANARRDGTLQGMLNAGKITQERYEELMAERKTGL